MAAHAEATGVTTMVHGMKRRGLIAGAAALVAGIAATQMSQPVAAAYALQGDTTNGSTTTTTITGAINPSTGTLQVINTIATSGVALVAHCDNANYGFGIQAIGSAYGVQGTGNTYAGVFGDTANDSASGVTGLARSSLGGTGVSGACDAANGFGVRGSSANGIGVNGTSTSGTGVQGQSTNNIGVFGQGPQFGVVGNATANGGYGIYGLATANGTAGFAGGTNNASAYAAVFGGRVVIGDGGPGVPGGLIVSGSLGITGTKSAIVPDGSGGHRLMYCVESPESWFEDFGTGTLTGGKAEVKLAADFASTVDTSTLHVFLTPHDEAHHLAVKATNSGGFSVGADVGVTAAARGMKASDLNGSFTYRVVAKRKDVAAPRLAKVELPQVKLAFPTLPTPPPMPGGKAKP